MKKLYLCIITICCVLLGGCGDYSSQSTSSGNSILKTETSILDNQDKIIEKVNQNHPIIDNTSWTIETFPYFYEESKELINFYKEVISGAIDVEHDYVTLEKGGYFKRTISEKEYIYFGTMKDNMPDGLGIVFKATAYNGYCVERIGHFSDGYLEGMALVFDDELLAQGIIKLVEDYEGTYQKGKCTGEGIQYNTINPFGVWVSEFYDMSTVVVDDDVEILQGMAMRETGIYYVGEFENCVPDGEGISFFLGIPDYIGTFKKGEYKKGKAYDWNGNLVYEGEFSNGKYHGNGTLYNSDGSIRYEGEFKNGDIK